MPFKSEAQKRKFREMLKEGTISQATYNEWNSATGKAKLPERVGAPKTTPVRSVDDIHTEYKRRFGK